MINGGETPEPCHGLFMQVKQSRVVPDMWADAANVLKDTLNQALHRPHLVQQTSALAGP